MLKVLLAAIVSLTVLGSNVANAHGQDQNVAQLGERVTKVAGYGGLLAWSEWDDESKRYRLVLQAQGEEARRVDAVPGRKLPFDVDVGPDREGRPALVYSRCRREPDTIAIRNAYVFGIGLANYPAASGCDLFLYSPAEDDERELDDMSMESASEYLPTLWKGNVAFARRYRSGPPARLYLNRRDGNRSRRLGAGPEADYGPASLDLRGERLAYHWINLVNGCDDADTEGESSGPFEDHLRLVAPGDKPFDVAVACDAESDPISIIGGSWAGSQLVYARERIEGDRAGDLIARSSDGQRRTLGTYTVKGFLAYIAVGDDAIVGTLSERPDRVRIDRLSPLP